MVNINLLRNDNVKVIETEGKKLLAFDIRLAKRNEKPVFLTKNPLLNLKFSASIRPLLERSGNNKQFYGV